MERKVYVASSWDNPMQPSLVEELRRRGHKVYDFRHPHGQNCKSVWEELNVKMDGLYGEDVAEFLDHPLARKRFREHQEAMSEVDTCILLLPAGRSAHIEAGYLKGLGKKVYVVGSVFDELRPELMYLAFEAQGEKSVDKPPCHLTKYLSATEHEEGQVIDPMHLCS